MLFAEKRGICYVFFKFIHFGAGLLLQPQPRMLVFAQLRTEVLQQSLEGPEELLVFHHLWEQSPVRLNLTDECLGDGKQRGSVSGGWSTRQVPCRRHRWVGPPTSE